MSEIAYAYYIPSLKPIFVADYLKESFAMHLNVKVKNSLNLFLCRFSGEVSECALKIADNFSETCFIVDLKGKGATFLIAASQNQFCQIISFAENLESSKLSILIKEQIGLSNNSQFKIGANSWNGSSPVIMGILNITPDSFFDGGKHFEKTDYITIAEDLISSGAEILDIGGESTRPGSQSVSVEEELRRVLPAVEQIRSRFSIPISVDTTKPEVAEVVLSKGADMINDTSGLLHENEMIEVLKRYDASYCLMHTQGVPESMQDSPEYQDVISEVYQFFQMKLKKLSSSGIDRSKICIDPGIGFGKTFEHNLALQRMLPAFRNLGCLILLGTSNKSFIGTALDRDVGKRLFGSLATQLSGWRNGANIFRVHDVLETNDVLKMGSLLL